jgi:hypothetical protein
MKGSQQKEGFIVRTRPESYLRTAERAHQQAETALNPQEKDLLLTIERSLRRLDEIEDWQDEVEAAIVSRYAILFLLTSSRSPFVTRALLDAARAFFPC